MTVMVAAAAAPRRRLRADSTRLSAPRSLHKMAAARSAPFGGKATPTGRGANRPGSASLGTAFASGVAGAAACPALRAARDSGKKNEKPETALVEKQPLAVRALDTALGRRKRRRAAGRPAGGGPAAAWGEAGGVRAGGGESEGRGAGLWGRGRLRRFSPLLGAAPDPWQLLGAEARQRSAGFSPGLWIGCRRDSPVGFLTGA